VSNPNHYDTLGLDRRCTTAQIRAAYRRLVKQHHPDVNHTEPDATRRVQALNTAHATLSDPVRRADYDRGLDEDNPAGPAVRSGKQRDIAQDVMLRVEEFLRGATLTIRVNDPANPHGAESYELEVPADTAPGTKFRVPRPSHSPGAASSRVCAFCQAAASGRADQTCAPTCGSALSWRPAAAARRSPVRMDAWSA
jgi:DnaJ-class molecular chaperone